MYKLASRNNQRRYKVREIDFEPQGHTEGDFIASAANMSLPECRSERAALIIEKTKAEQELIASKRSRNPEATETIGLRIAGLCSRMALVNQRITELNQEDQTQAFRTAVREVCSPAQWDAIVARKDEILGAAKASWYAGNGDRTARDVLGGGV